MEIRITKKDLYLHRELWNWLSLHPESGKSDWPGWKWNGGDISDVPNDCFLCEAVRDKPERCGSGEGCPADWSPELSCIGEATVYSKWKRTESLRMRKKYAILVRDVPMKSNTVIVG